FLPRRAAVSREIHAAALASAEHSPRVHDDLPGAGDEDVRIVRVHGQTRAARVSVHEEHPIPRVTAVGRAKNTALLLRTGRASKDAREHDLRVRRVDDDLADASAFGQPALLPRRAGVRGLVDSITHDVAWTDGPRLPGTRPDDVRIGKSDGERSDRLHRLRIENRRERLAAIGRLPDATRRRARAVRSRVTRYAGGRRDPPGRRGAHVAEAQWLHRSVLRRREAVTLRGHGRGERQQDDGEGQTPRTGHAYWHSGSAPVRAGPSRYREKAGDPNQSVKWTYKEREKAKGTKEEISFSFSLFPCPFIYALAMSSPPRRAA